MTLKLSFGNLSHLWTKHCWNRWIFLHDDHKGMSGYAITADYLCDVLCISVSCYPTQVHICGTVISRGSCPVRYRHCDAVVTADPTVAAAARGGWQDPACHWGNLHLNTPIISSSTSHSLAYAGLFSLVFYSVGPARYRFVINGYFITHTSRLSACMGDCWYWFCSLWNLKLCFI